MASRGWPARRARCNSLATRGSLSYSKTVAVNCIFARSLATLSETPLSEMPKLLTEKLYKAVPTNLTVYLRLGQVSTVWPAAARSRRPPAAATRKRSRRFPEAATRKKVRFSPCGLQHRLEDRLGALLGCLWGPLGWPLWLSRVLGSAKSL